jgi:hypothetical protein
VPRSLSSETGTAVLRSIVIADERNVDDYNATTSVTFMILGGDLNPDLVSKMLGMFPTRSWRAGELPDMRVDNQKRLPPNRLPEWSCWKAFTPERLINERLEFQLQYWAETLTPKSSALLHFVQFGWEIVLDCYFATAQTELLELPASLLRTLGELHVNLDIHFFSEAANPPA